MRIGRCAPDAAVHISVNRPPFSVASSRIWLSPRQEVISWAPVRRKVTVTTGSRSRFTRRRTVVEVRVRVEVGVEVEITNSAGVTRTQRLAF